MHLNEIVQLQYEFDARHGWSPNRSTPEDAFRAVQKDLIGIVGEIGEFANIVKKLTLEADRDPSCDLADLLKGCHGEISEELVDAFIYLLRLASCLDIDIEQAFLDKLKINEQRFQRFERPKH